MISLLRFKISHGTTRTVVLLWRWALKFPSTVEWRLFLQGLLANMQETKFSEMKMPELCPVLWSLPGGFLVVMPRVKILSREEFDETDLETFVKNEGGSCVLPAEIKMDSFGWLNGCLVAVDYG